MISKNTEIKIRKQLNLQLSELKIMENQRDWRERLLKIENIIDLALLNGEKELITDLMQLLILINCSLLK
jgi:hypothetical protein